jgi:[protein-PII] uridylyltransferase
VTVCTWDRPGLFSHICGALTAAGLSILSAQIFSRTDRIILDTFYVVQAGKISLPRKEEHDRFFTILSSSLMGELDLPKTLAKQFAAVKPAPAVIEGERLPTSIHFNLNAAEDRSAVEIQTEDRIGLLYTITHALTELKTDITTAKICTEKGAAIDTFYLSELEGDKITDAERIAEIENELRIVLAKLK